MLNPNARQKMKARTGGEKGRHLRPRLAQKKTPEGKTSYELSWKVKVMTESNEIKAHAIYCA